MAFITDKQTLDDLNIFGKHGSDSVFSVFNRTCTAGGAAMLEEMFVLPLSDAHAINDRTEVIREFAEHKITFPFDTELFSLVEHYLSNTDERTKISHEQTTISKKLINMIASDNDYKTLHKGVVSLKDILVKLYDFVNTVQVNRESSYSREQQSILSLLKAEPFAELINKRKETLSQTQIAAYDTLFRFKQRNAIRQILQFIYLSDVYIAVAKVATERNLYFAKALPDKTDGLRIQNVYHLLLKKPVSNSIEITADKNIVFLTGANMAGKSTFMKTVGIAIFLAHAGFPVPAREMEFAVMDGLYTTINLPDNLGMGASHFYTEVLRVKKVAKELGVSKNIFVIFDELFRGTNVKDAYEATVAIISAFSKKASSMFIISTHIIEAGAELKQNCHNMQFLYLPTLMEGNHPVYTYTLEHGITNDRHGMIIIQNEKILEILKAKAKQPVQ